jgi:chromosome partitioning protein
MKTIAFFNNKGGVGKTSMVYHLAWMLRDMGHSVLAADLDPQSNLTSMFLREEDIELLWEPPEHNATILHSIDLLMRHKGDINPAELRAIQPGLFLLAGDLALGRFEDRLSRAWSDCTTDNPAEVDDGFTVMTAFHRILEDASIQNKIEFVLIDVGPSIGSLNRAALVTADFVAIPIGADLFSLQGLRNLGPTLRQWRGGWKDRLTRSIPDGLSTPSGAMAPLGYILLNPSVRENRPVKSYLKWANRIPETYAREVLEQDTTAASVESDPHQLAMLKHFKSLMPMAQDARKPMFHLTAADGAIGGHASAVQDCKRQFNALAARILDRIQGKQGQSRTALT